MSIYPSKCAKKNSFHKKIKTKMQNRTLGFPFLAHFLKCTLFDRFFGIERVIHIYSTFIFVIFHLKKSHFVQKKFNDL